MTAASIEARSPTKSHRNYVSYIDKSREFYAAHGYEQPYRWATNTTAPFTPLAKPLSECTVGVVTTSMNHREDHTGPAPSGKEAYAAAADPPPERMFTSHLSWDKDATHTDDVETFLPLRRLAEFAASGRIGKLGSRFYSAPSVYSQRQTASDSEQIEQWCREDAVDLVVLVPL